MRRGTFWTLIGLLVLAAGAIGALLVIAKRRCQMNDDGAYEFDDYDFDDMLEDGEEEPCACCCEDAENNDGEQQLEPSEDEDETKF